MSYTSDPAADTTGDDPGADAPLSQRDDAALAIHIGKCERDHDAAAAEWLREAREAYDFVAGHQWSDEDIAALRDAQRPEITFNRVGVMVDAVCGYQVNNRLETRYVGRTVQDGAAVEMLGGALSWVRDGCDAEDEESDAFRDAAITGLGFVEWRVDYTDDPEGRLLAERCSPLEMGFDPASRQIGLADAGWFFRRVKMPADEVYSRWPDARLYADAASGTLDRGAGGGDHTRPSRDGYAEPGASTQLDRDGIEVMAFAWCERVTEYLVLNAQTGQIERLTGEAWANLGEKVGREVRDASRHVRQSRKTWYRAFRVNGHVCERGPCPDPQHAPWFVVTGKRDENTGRWYGLVRGVMDPQRWANKWFAQSVHILNTTASSGVLAEEGAIPDLKTFKEDWAKPGSVSLVAPGAMSRGAVVPKQPGGFPPGLQQCLQFAIASINDVSGINKEMLGTVDREQAGVLEWQRKQAAQAVIAPLFDAMRRYYKASGRSLLVMLRQFISPAKLIRIVDANEQPQVVQAAMLPDVAQFDVVVDQSPTSPNQKMESWAALQPVMPMLVKALPPPVLVPFLRHSPLPESVVKEIEQAFQQVAQQQQQQGPPPEVMKMQAEMQMRQQEMQMQMQAKQAETEMQMAAEERRLQMEMAAEMQRLQMEREKHAFELLRAREKAQLDIQIAAMRADQQMRIAALKPQPQAAH